MNQAKYPKRILVQASQKLITKATTEIAWIEAYGDYLKLHMAKEIYFSNFGITMLEARLNPDQFISVHPSFIININFIKEASKYLAVMMY